MIIFLKICFLFAIEMIVCSIDPAFKKCAFVVMDSTNFKILFAENVNFLDGYVKSNQTEYIKQLWK
jgi:hypothetical protein